MNALSLILYTVSVLSSISVLSEFLLFGFVIYFCGRWFAHGVSGGDISPPGKNSIWVFIVLAILIVFIPQQTTMYMIAGSEIAESVAYTEEGQELLDSVRQTILHQLEEARTE